MLVLSADGPAEDLYEISSSEPTRDDDVTAVMKKIMCWL
jgi:hypothetical protein